MANNPLFNILGGNQSNSVFNRFGGRDSFIQRFQAFKQQFSQTNQNVSPYQITQNLLNSGRMTQSQFDELRKLANEITGKNY